MWFKTEPSLDETQTKVALKNIIGDGIASQAMGIFTGGAFLAAFAVKLGASNFEIGLLAAIGPLAQLLQLPSILIVEKMRISFQEDHSPGRSNISPLQASLICRR